MKPLSVCICLLLCLLLSGYHTVAEKIRLHIWYGPEQHFGTLGQTQRWINVLGNVSPVDQLASLTYSLNGGPADSLSTGSDLHRLAMPGDFNIELSWESVKRGKNTVLISAQPKKGKAVSREVTVWVEKGNTWPLPYWLDFSKVEDLQKAVQVVDGHWEMTEEGVRTSQQYYDRVLSMGDTSWSDYETTVKLTVHDFTPSEPGPPTYHVTHFGVAMRWRGHHQDGRQPGRKWFPLGAQGEFLLKDNPDSCRWRILFDGRMKEKPPVYAAGRNQLRTGQPMYVKSQIVTLPDGRSRYRFKQWMATESESSGWDVEGYEKGDYSSGALCLVPHNSDVTIHAVRVEPVISAPGNVAARPGPGAIHYGAPVGGIYGAAGTSFQADFLQPLTRILSLQVNLGPAPAKLIKGMKFRLRQEGGKVETLLIGNPEGDWQEAFSIPEGNQLIGISGASGWYLDALQFHFSQGLTSPRYGGDGGDTEFDIRIPSKREGKSGRIRGFHGSYATEGIENLGLIFDPAD